MPNHELDNDNLPDMPESASQQEDGVEAQIHEHEAASDASSRDRKDIALHDQHHLPPNVYLIPIRERPFFPKQTLPVVLNKETWIETFKNIERSKQWLVGLVYTPDASDQAKPEEFSDIGTLIRIHNPRVHDDRIQFIAEGVKRFKIEHWLSEAAPYRAHVSYPEDEIGRAHV